MDLVGFVTADKSLTSEEKETIIRFDNNSKKAVVHSFKPTAVRWLIRHPESTLVSFNTSEGRVNASEIDSEDGLEIHGVYAEIPLSILSLKRRPRQSDQPSSIFSTLPEED